MRRVSEVKGSVINSLTPRQPERHMLRRCMGTKLRARVWQHYRAANRLRKHARGSVTRHPACSGGDIGEVLFGKRGGRI